MAYYLGPSRDGLPIEPFLGAVAVRDLAVVMLCVLVIRGIWRPEHDPIRAAGDGTDDDPHGGVLDGAPDALVLRTRWSLPLTRERPAAGRP
jgi:hypothetical protein